MATTKQDLLERIHKHDVKVSYNKDTASTIRKSDFTTKLGLVIEELPVFEKDTLEVLETLYRAEILEDETRHYGTDNEEHFGFSVMEFDDVEWVQINFNEIPSIIFATATHCHNETFDFNKLVVANDGTNCVLNVEMLEELHSMFVNVIGFCRDFLEDRHINTPYYFYAYSTHHNDWNMWIVPAKEIRSVFGDDVVKQDYFEIEDDGFAISFEKIPLSLFEKEEFLKESDRYKLVHLSEAVKRIMIDYFMSPDKDDEPDKDNNA